MRRGGDFELRWRGVFVGVWGKMIARPVYRSRLFWLGVPGLVFLLWVWWDSGGRVSYAKWVRGNTVDDVRVTGGRVDW